jgi:copper(I)-binding protein
MKNAIVAPVALVLMTLALGACDSQPQKAAPARNARPDAPEGITITDGRLVLPAVKGNPGAVYFTVHNDSATAATITGATVKGAKDAMIHRMTMANGVASMDMVSQIDVPAMGMLEFKPGGLHVMAMDLDDTLAKGGTTDVWLTFAGGTRADFPVEVLAAGDAR